MAEAACLDRADAPCSVSAGARVQGPTTALQLLQSNGYVIFDRLLSDKPVDLPRTGLSLSYSLGWLKQYENTFLAYSSEVAKKFPKALEHLIGYRVHRPNLGGYRGQDPSVLFETTSHILPAIDAIPADIEHELRDFYDRNRSIGLI